MNIFYLSEDPKLCAEWAVDRHCVKMILEAAQLLSTAHRVLDGEMVIEKRYVEGSFPARYRNVKTWRLSDFKDERLYSATHVNHPSAIWCRESVENYNWLWSYLYHHCQEYSFRYGKVHKVEESDLLTNLIGAPKNIPQLRFTQPPSAMDKQYILYTDDPIGNYRNYYTHGKAHLHSWKNRLPPPWLGVN
jgi:hypothetical protein